MAKQTVAKEKFDKIVKRTSIGNSSRSKPKNKHKLKSWKKYNRQGWMWSIYTIMCVLGLSINPMCTINGKLPLEFDNFETCDKAVDSIVLELNQQLKDRGISLVMICKPNAKIST